MDATKTIDTQVTLPTELYEALAQQAQTRGHSVSNEIVVLLTPLVQISSELNCEFAAWEAASDENWLSMEEILASADTVAGSSEEEN